MCAPSPVSSIAFYYCALSYSILAGTSIEGTTAEYVFMNSFTIYLSGATISAVIYSIKGLAAAPFFFAFFEDGNTDFKVSPSISRAILN
jgi:hypothetical protein